MDTRKTKTTIWSAAFISVFIANFATNMGQYMMNTLVPKYVNSLGAAASMVGTVTSMFAVTALLIRPVTGPAFDYFSKKKLYMLAIAVICLAFMGYSRSVSVEGMMIFRLVHGIGMGCTAPLGLSIATDTLPADKTASGIGVFSIGQAVATAIGPSIGLSLSEKIGYQSTFFIGAMVMLAACLLCLVIREKKPEHREPFKISLDRIIAVKALVPAAMYVFLSVSYSCINSYMAIYGGERGVDQIGLFFTAYAVVLLVSRPLSGALMDKKGLAAAMVPACILFAFAFFLVSIAHSLPMFLAAGAVSALGFGASQPAIQALCMRSVPPSRRGAAANTNYTGADLGNLLGPIIGGRVAEYAQGVTGSTAEGYAWMYRFMMIPMAVALLIFLVNRKQLIRNYVQPQSEGAPSES